MKISPTPTLSLLGLSRLLVLRHLELVVLVAPSAVGVARLGDVNHGLAGVCCGPCNPSKWEARI